MSEFFHVALWILLVQLAVSVGIALSIAYVELVVWLHDRGDAEARRSNRQETEQSALPR